MKTEEMLKRFESEYLNFHGVSKPRAREVIKLLRQLCDHAERELSDITADDLRAFMAELNESDLKKSTVAKKLKMLKPYFGWAWEVGKYDAEEYMRVKAISPPRGSSKANLPRPYSKKDLTRFWADLDRRWPRSNELIWRRYRNGTSHFRKVQPEIMRVQVEAIVSLALRCGLRRHEIFAMSINDMHYDNAYVVVREGKGDKYREVPHTEASREAVRAWLELRTTLKPKHDNPWLCLAWKKIALQPMREDRFNELMRTMGKWEYHRFRHTYGTEMLRSTKRIELVQRLLGHASLQQTLVYAQLVNTDLLKAVEKSEATFEEAVA